MAKSLSLDLRSEAHSQKHNMRQIELANVNSNLSYRNIVLKDEKLVDTFHMLFDNAVEEYNKKQKRKDRRKDNYFKEIKNSKKYKTCYEMVLQIGDRKDTGIFNDDLEVEALKRYFDEWENRNPNLHCFSAVIHRDESCTHLHLAFTPVAHAETNIGMQLTPSLSLALKQQGVEPDMSHKKKQKGKKGLCSYQIGWQHREREYIKDVICKDLSIEIKALQDKERKHFETEEYKEYRDRCNAVNKEYREKRKKSILEQEKIAHQQEKFERLQKDTEKLDKYAKDTLRHIETREKHLEEKEELLKEIDEDIDELENIRYELEKRIDKDMKKRQVCLGLDERLRDMDFEQRYNNASEELQNLKDFCDKYMVDSENNISVLDEFEFQEQQIRIEIEREKRKKRREEREFDDDDYYIR